MKFEESIKYDIINKMKITSKVGIVCKSTEQFKKTVLSLKRTGCNNNGLNKEISANIGSIHKALNERGYIIVLIRTSTYIGIDTVEATRDISYNRAIRKINYLY